MTRPPLAVHLYDRHVADIHDTGFGDTAVQYTAAAVAAPLASRLSLSLPVRAELHPTVGPGGRWVRSLLPEGRALAWAVTAFGIPEDDRYGLIAALGRDVAGAVEVRAPGAEATGPGRYEPLDADAVATVVGRAHRTGLGLDRQRGVRLSLAGMQDKVLLHHVDGRYVLPVDGAPSTVIVKPEPPTSEVGGIASNELLCLTLARRSGLEVATAGVEQFGSTPALVVRRYDRRVTGAVVERVHQEDFLGAMGVDPLLKYERPHAVRHIPAGGFADTMASTSRGGPSLADIAGMLGEHFGRARLGRLLAAVTFNVAIGNADAHARNYSLLLPRDGMPRFAPLYDLIATRAWPDLDTDAAQRVNGVDDIDAITVEDLVAEAVGWGTPTRIARRVVAGQLEAIVARLDRAATEAVALGGDPAVIAEVRALIGRRVMALAGP